MRAAAERQCLMGLLCPIAKNSTQPGRECVVTSISYDESSFLSAHHGTQ